MGSFNRIILMGNLGANPEVRQVGQTKVASFNMATSSSWTSQGSKQERTTWHRIVAWARLADVAESSLGKGSPVLIEGTLESREFTGKDGAKQKVNEVRATSLQLVERRADAEARRDGARPVGGGADHGFGDYTAPVASGYSEAGVPF